MPQNAIFSQKTELCNNDFRNQRIHVSNNSCVAKNQTKNAYGCHILVSTTLTAHSISRDL